MSACAEPRPLQIECNDLLFEEGFKFVHLLMDRLITQTRPYRHCQNYSRLNGGSRPESGR
jgi:hypothetical protein